MAVKGGGGGGKSGAIRAGRAFVELTADDTEARTTLSRFRSYFLKFGAGMAAAGGALFAGGAGVLGFLGKAFQETIQHFDEVKKASDRLGTSAESISALGYAAEQSGSNMAELEAAAKHLQKNLEDNADEFAAIGLNAEKLKGMSLEDQFAEVAEAIAGMDSASQRTAAAMTLMGKSGTKMLPLMKDGAKGVRALLEESGKVGSTISSKDAAAAERAGDAIDRAWKSVKNTFLAVGAALLPNIDRIEILSAVVVELVAGVREFINDNRGLVTGIAAGAAAAVALGSAFIGVGTTLAITGLALGGITTAVAAVGAALAFIAPFVVPVVAVVAALTAVGAVASSLIADFVDLTDVVNAGSMAWDFLAKTFNSTWNGISDALATGDLKLALKAAMAGVEVVWAAGVLAMTAVWNEFKGAFVDTFHEATTGVELAWNEVTSAIEMAMLAMMKRLADRFQEFFSRLLKNAAAISSAVGADETADLLNRVDKLGASDVLGMAQDMAERNRKAKEEEIKAAHDKAQADRNAARATDLLGAAADLAAKKANLAAIEQQAALQKNVQFAAGFMNAFWKIAFNQKGMKGAQAAMSSLVQGGFGGANANARFGTGGSIEKKQLDEMKGMNEKLNKIEKNIGGVPFE